MKKIECVCVREREREEESVMKFILRAVGTTAPKGRVWIDKKEGWRSNPRQQGLTINWHERWYLENLERWFVWFMREKPLWAVDCEYSWFRKWMGCYAVWSGQVKLRDMVMLHCVRFHEPIGAWQCLSLSVEGQFGFTYETLTRFLIISIV